MSESLSEDELAELIHSGRINTSRLAAKRHQTKTSVSIRNRSNKTQESATIKRDSPLEGELPKSSGKEPDPEWLRTEKEKADRNIAALRQDKRRQEEMREASRF